MSSSRNLIVNEGPLASFKEEQMSCSGCGGRGGVAGQLCCIFCRSYVRLNFGQAEPTPVHLVPYRHEQPMSVFGESQRLWPGQICF